MKKINSDIEETGMSEFEDNQFVKYAGIVTSVKKNIQKQINLWLL